MANRKPLVIVGGLTTQLPTAETLEVPGTTLSINGVSYTFPASGAAGVLANDGANLLSWRPAREATSGTATTTTAATTSVITQALANNTVYLVEAYIVGRRTDAADRAGYVRRAVVYREAAGAAVIQGTVDASLTRESDGTWDATIAVSGNNVTVDVTGKVGSTINWQALLFWNKVA